MALAVSEVMTNAFEHGEGDVTVIYGAIDTDSYEVSVASSSSKAPRRSPELVPPDHVTGRGLNIVAAVSDDLTMFTDNGVVTVTCRFRRA